jgi:NAD(P)-dependent dehydrogenase (short-subunit alcohol dehydrogenase family)
MKTWFITGASRGIGLEIARAAIASGHNVVATARNPSSIEAALGQSDRLLAHPLDVTDAAASVTAAQVAQERFGSIDVLVNNAGYGHLGWFENSTDEQVRAQFEVNLFGSMNVTRAILPFMRDQKRGHVFTVSSVAGLIAVAGASIYASSKFAVEGWMEALAAEIEPLGLKATIIEPGFFKTDFLDPSSASFPPSLIADYAKAQDEFMAFHADMNHKQQGDPAKLGSMLVSLAEMASPPVRIAAGSDGLEWAVKKSASLKAEAERWAELSSSTDAARD